MKGGRDEAPWGCGLREEDLLGVQGEHRGYFEELGKRNVFYVHYFTHHKCHFLGILFEQPRNRSFPCELS